MFSGGPGCFHPRTSFFIESPVIFIICCHPKTPFLCVRNPLIYFHVHVTKKKQNKTKQNKKQTNKQKNIFTEKSLIFVTKRPFFFKLTLSPKDPYFLNA